MWMHEITNDCESVLILNPCVKHFATLPNSSLIPNQGVHVTFRRSQYIVVGDKAFEFNPNFRMFFITKLSNPHFSPELSAKTTVIDFAVTQRGLEDQLLSKVINAVRSRV